MFNGKKYNPSPSAWEDQVLYFLMLDRFSNAKENRYVGNDGQTVLHGTTPPFTLGDLGNATCTEEDAGVWREAGGKWVGGTLSGLTSKIGYLKRLGITAIWISPLFKQICFQETYHGYGIQNYLDVDPHFGTREDLKSLVATAHKHGIHVILDIILNHSGNVFAYNADRYPTQDWQGRTIMDPRWDASSYTVRGFNDKSGNPALPFQRIDLAQYPQAWPDGAV
jgi:glycosidase